MNLHAISIVGLLSVLILSCISDTDSVIDKIKEMDEAVGYYESYKPKKKISFSHKVHSRDNEIDCKFCHVENLKVKLNTCVDCHNIGIEMDSNKVDYSLDFLDSLIRNKK